MTCDVHNCYTTHRSTRCKCNPLAPSPVLCISRNDFATVYLTGKEWRIELSLSGQFEGVLSWSVKLESGVVEKVPESEWVNIVGGETNTSSMANPFKSGDKVLTFRKGIEIEATVRTTWNHEVQVRTTDGDLIWRTMKTIRSVTVPETGQPADTPQNPDSGTEVTQAEPPEDVQTQGTPVTVEPVTGESAPGEPVIVEPDSTVEPASQEPGAVEPATGEPVTGDPAMAEPADGQTTGEPESASEDSDQPAEPEPQQSGKGAAKPTKRRKGILRKLMFDDNFDG